MRTGARGPATPDDANALEFVGCDRPLLQSPGSAGGQRRLRSGRARGGRLEFRGPSATSGYYRNVSRKPAVLLHGRLARLGRSRLHGPGRTVHHRAGGGHQHPRRALTSTRRNWKGRRQPARHPQGLRRGVRRARSRHDHGAARGARRDARNGGIRARTPAYAHCALAVDLTGIAPDDIVLAPPHGVLKTHRAARCAAPRAPQAVRAQRNRPHAAGLAPDRAPCLDRDAAAAASCVVDRDQPAIRDMSGSSSGCWHRWCGPRSPCSTPHVGAGRHPRGGAAAAVAHRHTLARARPRTTTAGTEHRRRQPRELHRWHRC